MSSQQEIDDLTLSLFMNKSRYNKYIAKTDPVAYSEKQEYLKQLHQFRNEILSITDGLIENPDESGVSSDLLEVFTVYTKKIIQYVHQEKAAAAAAASGSGTGSGYSGKKAAEDDEDMMFGTVNETVPSRTSFWSGEKVLRSQYPMNR
jgi:hypothetical protein